MAIDQINSWIRPNTLDTFHYSVVDLKRYRKATSYSRSVQLLGFTTGSVLGQLIVSFNLMSYNNMVIFTLVLTAIALFTSCFLPMPQRSMFFHRKHSGEALSVEGVKGTVQAESRSNGSLDEMRDGKVQKVETKDAEKDEGESDGAKSCSQVILQLWRDFRQCYSSRQLLYWSLWWAMATCGYNQTVNYVQVGVEGKIK